MTETEMMMSNDPEIRFLGRELFSQHATKFDCEKFIIQEYGQSEIQDSYILEFLTCFYEVLTEGKKYCSGQIADIIHELYFR